MILHFVRHGESLANDADRVARASEGLGQAMASLESRTLAEQQLLANRGW